MEIEFEGVKVKANIIGGFQIDEKQYAVCSYEDELNNCKIIILQTETDVDTIKTKEIPEEDVDKVMNVYEKIKKEIMEEAYE